MGHYTGHFTRIWQQHLRRESCNNLPALMLCLVVCRVVTVVVKF